MTEQVAGGEKMEIDVAFTILNIIRGRKARNRKEFPHVKSEGKETIRRSYI